MILNFLPYYNIFLEKGNSMLKLDFIGTIGEFDMYNIIVNNITIGSIELIEDTSVYIQNMYIQPQYRGNKYFKDILKILKKRNKPIDALPLEHCVSYFESLGFKKYKVDGEDVYYRLIPNFFNVSVINFI